MHVLDACVKDLARVCVITVSCALLVIITNYLQLLANYECLWKTVTDETGCYSRFTIRILGSVCSTGKFKGTCNANSVYNNDRLLNIGVFDQTARHSKLP